MRLLKISAVALACGVAAYALPPAYAGWGGHGDHKARFEHFCSADNKMDEKIAEHQARRLDHMAERLKLTDAQKSAFKDVQAIRAKAMTDGRAALCAAKPGEMTFEKRLEFRQTRLQARLDTMKVEAPKLVAFYNSLDDKQKAEFDTMRKHRDGGREEGRGHGEGGWRHHHED